MANTTETVTIRGKLSFAKLLGDPVLNYSKDGKEWKTDFYDFPVKEIKALGIGDRVKEKDTYLDGKPYMSFKHPEYRKDGETRNDPIKITDILGKPWDDNKLLGNGTVADLKFRVVDFGKGKKKGVYLQSVRVLDLVSYEKQTFDPIDETDEFFAAAQAAAAEAEAKSKLGKTILEALDEEIDSPFDLPEDEMPV